METFEDIVERYMQFDKKTLAELLAIKEISENSGLRKRPSEFDIKPNPNTTPFWPYPCPPTTVPELPPRYGDWIITCKL